MATEATARKFFTSPAFAVVGASSNTAKFGHKGEPLVDSSMTYTMTDAICLHSLRLVPRPQPSCHANQSYFTPRNGPGQGLSRYQEPLCLVQP